MQVAVVGAGAWGGNIIRNLAELNALGAICDPNPERLAAYAESHPGVRTETDYRALLDGECRAVAIATPTSEHFGLMLPPAT